MKVLNLYAGIGGNRKKWTDVDVTAVEWDEKIAAIYQDFFPDDKVIVTDAHQYLLEHFKEYDFIWSSPPCPTHSRFNLPLKNKRYPDMKLYQEIIFLSWFFKGKYCIENVISYYGPLIKPYKIDGHYFWTNFVLNKNNKDRELNSKTISQLARELTYDINILQVKLKDTDKVNLSLRNCVYPETGEYILNRARGIIKEQDVTQKTIFD